MNNDMKTLYQDVLDNVLPQALMIGVDYKLFWELNPNTLQPFIKAFELRQKELDRQYWLQGLYVQYAVASCVSEKNKYPEKPFSLNKPKTIKEKFLERMTELNARFEQEVK